MIDFGEHIVAGTVLVIDAIESPNFVTGVSGWIIRQDGTVEFANATIRGTLETDGANGAYIRVTNVIGPSGLAESVIIFRPGNTTGLVPDWLPDADIGIGMFRAYGASPSGLLSRGQLFLDVNGVAFASGVGAPTTYSVVSLASPTFDGTTQPNPVITLADNNSTGNVDIFLNGAVSLGASGRTVTVPAKFGRENALINFPNTLTANTGVTLNLNADTAIFNTSSMWNIANPNRITAPRNGQYEVGMYVKFTAQAATAGLRFGIIQQNGATIIDKADPTSAAQNGFATSVLLTQRVQATAGDNFTFACFQNSGANLALISPSRGWLELIEST